MAYEDILDKLHKPDLPYPQHPDEEHPSGLPWEGYYYSAYGIAVKHGYVGTEEEWLASLKGNTGDPGEKGDGITAVEYNDDGTMTVTYGDGETATSPNLKGAKGDPGNPGAKGDPGNDGVSPSLSSSAITGGHKVTMTDATHTETFNVMDGSGNGDMLASVYDPNGDVAAVGIPAYVAAHVERGIFIGTINTTPYADFLAAYNAGKAVYAKQTITALHQTDYFPLAANVNGALFFARINGNITYQYKLTSDGSWTLWNAELQAEITASGILKGDGAGGVSAATAGTDYVATNDSRLTDSRTPKSHTHGNISNDGKIGGATLDASLVHLVSGALQTLAGEAVSGGAQIATGSYIGTGTYGADNPNSITFPFEPKIVMMLFQKYNDNILEFYFGVNGQSDKLIWGKFVVSMNELSTDYMNGRGFLYNNMGHQYHYAKKSADGKTISWYYTTSAQYQLNFENCTYYWLAIG